MTFIKRGRAFKRALAATAITVAMAATAAGTASAAGGPEDAVSAQAQAVAKQHPKAAKNAKTAFAAPRADAAGTAAPHFAMSAVNKQDKQLSLYFPNGTGGFEARYPVNVNYDFAAGVQNVDNDKDGFTDGTYTVVKDGRLLYADADANVTTIGGGWQTYNTILSPGNLGGAPEADVFGIDKSGVMYVYLGYADGHLNPRLRVSSGWGLYNQIAGQADLTGDGRADIVARDKAGTLWLYKGTGNYKAPFANRVSIGGGWNMFDRLLSIGDMDSDGITDLIARTPSGEVYRYSGTGNASAPLKARVKIGVGFQNWTLL
ncbi:VCBS repeat-containing protein [Streptomyces sp. SPB162]|uniref:FG-GAP repeat domain-containing protein n=1 Tax=Streptomyces sp. SPB162 TaxID=2940560 RepID=UPI0024058F05|nr:VCBS repeat-containing protein [Streptomyces sp. SPB162]MDF9814102.1 hypothetical protein [Streptomyces sp. SPB162]